MVSFLSFPWNGSDPVSISNCRATQNRSKCSDQPPLPSGETQTGSVRPSSRGHSKSWSNTCRLAHVVAWNRAAWWASAFTAEMDGRAINSHQLSSTTGSRGQCWDGDLQGWQDMATHPPRGD